MTNVHLDGIVGIDENRATGPERKGNAAETYIEYRKHISPV